MEFCGPYQRAAEPLRGEWSASMVHLKSTQIFQLPKSFYQNKRCECAINAVMITKWDYYAVSQQCIWLSVLINIALKYLKCSKLLRKGEKRNRGNATEDRKGVGLRSGRKRCYSFVQWREIQYGELITKQNKTCLGTHTKPNLPVTRVVIMRLLHTWNLRKHRQR